MELGRKHEDGRTEAKIVCMVHPDDPTRIDGEKSMCRARETFGIQKTQGGDLGRQVISASHSGHSISTMPSFKKAVNSGGNWTYVPGKRAEVLHQKQQAQELKERANHCRKCQRIWKGGAGWVECESDDE